MSKFFRENHSKDTDKWPDGVIPVNWRDRKKKKKTDKDEDKKKKKKKQEHTEKEVTKPFVYF